MQINKSHTSVEQCADDQGHKGSTCSGLLNTFGGRYLPMLVRGRRRPAAVAIRVRVLAGAQVPLDLALVDQVVVVLPFRDDPDTPDEKGDAGPACA
jgi:hypothetical protein